MKKGVIFDMDGLLLDTEQIWQANWHKQAALAGVEFPEEFPKYICGTSGQLMLDVIHRFFPTVDAVQFMTDTKAGVKYDLQHGEIPEKPGLHEILAFFKEAGCKIAVASSSDKDQIRHNLEKSGVIQYFDVIVSGQQAEHGKPAPDIFLMAAAELGLANEDCYVFEDAINGVKAGIASGSATIMIPDVMAPTEECRTGCVGIYDSLLSAMEAIRDGRICE